MAYSEKFGRIVLYLLIAVFGRLLLQFIPGAAPILPVALYTGALYGLEAAIFVGAGAFFLSAVLIHAATKTFLFDTFTIIRILIAIGFIVASIVLSVKILKIGKHGAINSEILVYRVIIATVFLEIAISLMQGEFWRTPDSFYHLFANIVIAAAIGGAGKKEEKSENKH